MSKIIIIGAGAMGTAFAFPCLDNNHDVSIVGTHLEKDFIDKLKKNSRLHPGLSIKITPQKPTITADQRRHPTFSLKKIAEPAVTSKGIACKNEETVDKEIKDIAYTIKIAPSISDIVRKNIKGF